MSNYKYQHSFELYIREEDGAISFRVSPSWVRDGLAATPREALTDLKAIFEHQIAAIENILATQQPENAGTLLGDGALGFEISTLTMLEPEAQDVARTRLNELMNFVFKPEESFGEENDDDGVDALPLDDFGHRKVQQAKAEETKTDSET